MQENYQIEDLLIGELVTISSMGGFYGTIELTEGPFIFYKKGETYSEIFTEEEYGLKSKPSESTKGRDYKLSKNSEVNTFGKTYIRKIDDIVNYLNEEELLEFELIVEHNRCVDESNDIRSRQGESLLLKSKNICLTKKRLLEIYGEMKERQVLRTLERKEEEEKIEQQFIKKNRG